MERKKIFILTLLIMIISTLSLVSAVDDSGNIMESDNVETDDFSDESTNTEAYDDNSFTALINDIEAADDDVDITKDYSYNPIVDDEERNTAIVIENCEFTINGNNHVIDGRNTKYIFVIMNSIVEINNLTLKNAADTSIYCKNSSIITNNVVFEGSDQEYRAVYADSSNYDSKNDVFINNYNKYGSAVYTDNSLVNITNATFKTNKDSVWGMLYFENSNFNVTNTTFNDLNSKYSTAIYTLNGTGNIENCNFINLEANLTAGAIGLKAIEDNILIRNCSFVNITSMKNGGAIYADVACRLDTKGRVYLHECVFTNCTSGFGGAILQLGGYLDIDECRFNDNFALYKGGAVYTSFTDLVIINSIFKNNELVLFDDSYSQGGALYFDYATLDISDSTFED
ncbi:MAG: hypothetical protein J6S29_07215, partial [Methanosphaera sp.]|nr:hypothetical protein [Methanosphaera sp.]